MIHRFIFSLLVTLLPIYCHAQQWWQKGGFSPYIHQYMNCYSYEGDSQGNFKNDLVVQLDDSSSWKIHPDHCHLLANWLVGDQVHVEVRTTWYLYHRNHKFSLYNHRTNESLFVMLIDTPFVIKYAGDPQPTKRVDNGFFYQYSNYKQNITLSNGTEWEVTSYERPYFNIGCHLFHKESPAYIGYNWDQTNDYPGSFFVIEDKGVNSNWAWAREGNYHYSDDGWRSY